MKKKTRRKEAKKNISTLKQKHVHLARSLTDIKRYESKRSKLIESLSRDVYFSFVVWYFFQQLVMWLSCAQIMVTSSRTPLKTKWRAM